MQIHFCWDISTVAYLKLSEVAYGLVLLRVEKAMTLSFAFLTNTKSNYDMNDLHFISVHWQLLDSWIRVLTPLGVWRSLVPFTPETIIRLIINSVSELTAINSVAQREFTPNNVTVLLWYFYARFWCRSSILIIYHRLPVTNLCEAT